MKKIMLLLVLASVLVLARGGMWGQQRNGGGSISVITEAQKATILYIYQEEKVARDVYITLGKIYPNEWTFRNIQESEQKHMNAMRNLCVKYKIDIEGVNESDVGVFIIPFLQTLYNQLITRGSVSRIEALYVGELIEIMDIKDLEDASVGMPSDVQMVLLRLKNGSVNHLTAFRRAIARELAK